MARTRRIKVDGDMHYHVMSRTNDRRYLFESGAVRDELADALRRAAAFCGVALKAYAVMGNHFHAVVKVAKPMGPVGADELLRRVGVLRGEVAMRGLSPGGRPGGRRILAGCRVFGKRANRQIRSSQSWVSFIMANCAPCTWHCPN